MYIFCKDINQQVLINRTDTLSCFNSFSDRTLLNPFLGTERSIHCDFLVTYTNEGSYASVTYVCVHSCMYIDAHVYRHARNYIGMYVYRPVCTWAVQKVSGLVLLKSHNKRCCICIIACV